MRADLIRLYKTLHTWTGIVAGLALFIAFYAGAFTVFKEPLARWVAPPMTALSVPLADTPALITRTLAAQPAAARDFQITLNPDAANPQRLTWQDHPEHGEEHDSLGAHHYAATLAADGSATIEATQPSQLTELIDILHRVVGLPFDNDITRAVMGVICMLYALALVSGVILVLPTLARDFFAMRISANLKRMWMDTHNVVGLISLPFHIVMAITAVVFAYHDGIYALQNKLFHNGNLSAAWAGAKPQHASPRNPADLLPTTELLARSHRIAPDFIPTSMQYLQVLGPRPTVRIWGHDDSSLSPRAMGGFVALDPYSGKVLSADFLPGRQNAANTTLASFFALHFGTFGGSVVSWMYFLLALAGAWLFYSGNLLWIESRRKGGRKASQKGINKEGQQSPPTATQRRDVRALANATVGVCLGCVAGISLTIVAGRWLYGHVTDLNAWHWYVYYAVFLASIAWAFWRSAARAAVELLWFATATTLAIPLTSLACMVGLLPGPWASADASGVDFTAFGGALALAWMARATTQRVRHGEAGSIWSALPEEAKAGKKPGA